MKIPAWRLRACFVAALQTAILGAVFTLPVAADEKTSTDVAALTNVTAQTVVTAQTDEKANHPLVPVLKIAAEGLLHIDANIADYSATLVKRERVRGSLETQYMLIKVRHEPYSVYMVFLGPEDMKDNEVIYVDGQNDGKMWARAGSGLRRRIGMVSLEPTGPLAMDRQRYPITMLGMRTLTQRLLEVGQQDLQHDEIDVEFHEDGKINGRSCSWLQATHPEPRKHFRYHMARIFIDDEFKMPVRFEAYLWPYKKGGKPVLVEQYTYLNIKVNQGFTDEDFNPRNEKYSFVDRKIGRKH